MPLVLVADFRKLDASLSRLAYTAKAIGSFAVEVLYQSHTKLYFDNDRIQAAGPDILQAIENVQRFTRDLTVVVADGNKGQHYFQVLLDKLRSKALKSFLLTSMSDPQRENYTRPSALDQASWKLLGEMLLGSSDVSKLFRSQLREIELPGCHLSYLQTHGDNRNSSAGKLDLLDSEIMMIFNSTVLGSGQLFRLHAAGHQEYKKTPAKGL